MFGGARGVFPRPKGKEKAAEGPPRPVKAFDSLPSIIEERLKEKECCSDESDAVSVPQQGGGSLPHLGTGTKQQSLPQNYKDFYVAGPNPLEKLSYPSGKAILAPDLPGLLSGFINSKLSEAMRPVDSERLKSAKTKEELYDIFDVSFGESITRINEKFISYIVASINLAGPTNGNEMQEIDSNPVYETIENIKYGADSRREKGYETPEFKRAARENLGIDPANLQAIKKVLALRKEGITVRPVGEGETAEKAAAYQRLNLPTKPFSIKLKSETSSGFIPMNQFDIESGKGRAETSKTLTLYNQLMGMSDDDIEGATDMLKNLIGIYQQTMELNADPGRIVKRNLWEKLKSLKKMSGADTSLLHFENILKKSKSGSGNLDNHSGKTGGEILVENPELQGTLVSENLEPGKEYLVNNSNYLPVVGDYDLYRIYTRQYSTIKQKTREVQGAGDTTSFVLGALIDLNIGAVLGGYEGGLLFHHGAEMHNEKHAQPIDKVLKITEEGQEDEVLNDPDAIVRDVRRENDRRKFAAIRPGTAMALRNMGSTGDRNPLTPPGTK